MSSTKERDGFLIEIGERGATMDPDGSAPEVPAEYGTAISPASVGATVDPAG